MSSDAWLEAAFRAVPVAMSFIDRDMRYVKVNAATAAITGRPIEEHAGATVAEINPKLSSEMDRLLRGVLENGKPVTNVRLSRPTAHAPGGALDLVMNLSAIREPGGDIAGLCVTATDVTEFRRMQDLVFQTQKLTAAGELAAGIAHDFNNLLTIIGSTCDVMLMEMPADAAHRSDVEEIRSAAQSATQLARRMLGTVHHRALAPIPLELRQIVQDAGDLLRYAVRGRVKVEFPESEGDGVVLVDSTQIEQVLLNLVINAVDAMPSGGTITISTRDTELPAPLVARTGELEAGPYAELTVADTGSGMDALTIARIFQPFFTTKPAGKGTGLGLATVFAIVRDLGGGIDVESAPGRGTTFHVLLPRVTSEEASGPRRLRDASVAALPRGHETILIVEDEDGIRASLCRVLQRFGYRVFEASHGGEALRILAAHDDIALIVSDLHMPGIDGRALAARVRALGHAPPILFLSGSFVGGEGGEASPVLDARDRFLQKPPELDALLTTVREMLQGDAAGIARGR